MISYLRFFLLGETCPRPWPRGHAGRRGGNVIFDAEVRQVKTMVDGTVNLTLNLPEYHIAEAQQFVGLIGEMVTLQTPDSRTKQDDKRREGAVRKGIKRKPERTPKE